MAGSAISGTTTEKTTPPQDPYFESREDGFFCQVTVSYDNKPYSGTGTAARKKQAEAAAYGVILQQLVAAGCEIAGAKEALAEISSSSAATPEDDASTTVSGPTPEEVSRALEKALVQLKMAPGDKNYIGCLNQFVQIARLLPVEYTTEPAIDENEQMGWKSSVTITLPGGTPAQLRAVFRQGQEGKSARSRE